MKKFETNANNVSSVDFKSRGSRFRSKYSVESQPEQEQEQVDLKSDATLIPPTSAITEWRFTAYHKNQLSKERELVKKADAEREARVAMAKWAASGSSNAMKAEVSKRTETDPYQLGIQTNGHTPFTLSQINPDLFKEQRDSEKLWNKQKEEVNTKLRDHEKKMERKFKRIMKGELQKFEEQKGREANNF